MAGRNGQELLSAWVPSELAAAFRGWARAQAGGASAALRDLVAQAVTGEAPAAPPGPGAGYRLTVRLQEGERAALLAAAQAQGVTPSTWVRALAVAHLARRPQWNPAELEALRDLAAEVRRIGANVNRLHWRLDVIMNEDQDRTKLGHGPHNLAVLRHMALNAMQQEPSKDSLRGKLQWAAWNEAYLTKVLALI
jgi:hypothetical protein